MSHQREGGGGRQGKLCPASRHTMDPNWTTCPYCKGAEAQGPPPADQPRAGQEQKMRNKTSYGESEDNERRRVTRFDEPGKPLQPAPRTRTPDPDVDTDSSNRIVAVLITYSRRPAGEIFPIREGRTSIGRDINKYQELCDIVFPDDVKMSSEHAVILYRSGRYQIIDQQSMNGTWVNDKDVEQTELHNYDVLKLGKTQFTFIKTEKAPPAEAVQHPAKEKELGDLR